MGSSSRLGGLLDQRDEDWRDTLFYWQGKLASLGGERRSVTWRGTWLSSVANVQPTATDFVASYNFFELSFDVPDDRDLGQGRWDLGMFCGLTADFRGHYLMEPPDGSGYRRAYRDEWHHFALERFVEHDDHHGPFLLCAARGTNEFGRFIALGMARKSRGAGTLDEAVELSLARRYVRDDDSRWHWPIDQVLASVAHASPNGTRIAPWEHSLPCRLPCDVIAEANRHAQLAAVFEPPKPPPRNEYEAMMARKRPRS